MASPERNQGEVFTSPWTGEQFTSRFAYNDHLTRWPEIAEANGLNLDGSAKQPALDALTIAQLRDLASEEGIDLGAVTKKAEIISVIETARVAPEPVSSEELLALFEGGDDALLKVEDLRRLLDEREVPHGEEDDHAALSAALAASLAAAPQDDQPPAGDEDPANQE